MIDFVNLDQYNQYMSWISADAAAKRLNVKRQTLYAYVSRGLLTACADTDDPRASLYAVEDVEALARRRVAGRKRADIAEATIAWGEPVLTSAITTVREGRLVYRGHDAVILAETATLEETARLLWAGPSPDSSAPSHGVMQLEHANAKERALFFLATRVASDPPSFGRAPEALVLESEGLLAGMTNALGGTQTDAPMHERLAQQWRLGRIQADLLRRSLVLLADHELNPSTFAARVAASTGASLAAAMMAGFATLTGPRHGEAAARALDFLKSANTIGADLAVMAWLARAQSIPATGHPLYPSGDPRAAAILSALRPSHQTCALIEAAEAATGNKANVDMALAALTHELELPSDAPFILFAAARTAGWLAHAMEQALSGLPIRPRANFVPSP